METNWIRIYNALFDLVNSSETYYSGPKFIDVVREVDPNFPDYNQYLEKKKNEDNRTSRKQYFYDILMSFNPLKRLAIINRILSQSEKSNAEKVLTVRNELQGDEITAPKVKIDVEMWNGERLNKYLAEIDLSIEGKNYERAITLSYTCLEGFYKAFVRAKIIHGDKVKNEIMTLSRTIQSYLKQTVKEYPDEAITMINHISHTVDRARNGYSEAHFGEETASWLAVYIRDLVNSQIRLLLHFL